MYLQASDTDDAIVAILRFHSGFFDHYLVNTVRMAGVGLHALESILATTDDEDSITVRANCQFNLVNFTFEDVETHESRNMAADIVAIPQYHVPFDDSIYRYEVVVGVPSEELRRIFVTLRNVGPGAAVVYITASKVRFYTIGQEITLTKENGECIIGGVKDDNEIICIPASLHKIDPILEASKLCGTVWLLYSTRRLTDSGRPPTMINCPIGLMANLCFYFIKE
ncbi:hypothetical protein Vadar_020060 [Vaccinium darrowii]|uniref:Uncharacterized protein n=1 Tax=Vaccinium darrowii TaxID=229202 RepID=A0ACB7Y9G0_9ERIC|nr:hypothetical protein Vadar_020060 [Vaccinium darrowii]